MVVSILPSMAKVLLGLSFYSNCSDAVETVTSETETWFKLRDRDFVIKAETDRDLEVRDRDPRPHISLMEILANYLNIAATKYLAHCQMPR